MLYSDSRSRLELDRRYGWGHEIDNVRTKPQMMDVDARLNKLAEVMGAIVVAYADDSNGGGGLLDELCSDPKRKRKVVRLNLVLLLAWGAMKKASQLLGEYPEAVQLFTDRLCETVYDNLGKNAETIEPLLYNRWSIYSDCEIESSPEGLEELAKSFDACCGDTIADPDMTRTYSLRSLRQMKIATEFMAFFSSIERTFVEALA